MAAITGLAKCLVETIRLPGSLWNKDVPWKHQWFAHLLIIATTAAAAQAVRHCRTLWVPAASFHRGPSFSRALCLSRMPVLSDPPIDVSRQLQCWLTGAHSRNAVETLSIQTCCIDGGHVQSKMRQHVTEALMTKGLLAFRKKNPCLCFAGESAVFMVIAQQQASHP
ncbi:hypothetical protein BAUCODRAFT_24159 [Baudoinia panamericana UAMH 10762]|uniref:Uncharacterized protein n=1 Tax=Baudoinia panamericana (strain UAMH 10762) TaxID=717646 RepID=M2NBU3_BAUPA|nr:uncharacterized protein BAUCODRAFT_24159 [Baudoinia panamericana UAMH 10762]EMC96365.1 hypothetical protein BAUCODRAFT_24159 [Baudoinia panamericana UAMH 10762]